MPIGRANVPMAFSTIRSASVNPMPPAEHKTSISALFRPANLRTTSSRSSWVFLYMPEMAELFATNPNLHVPNSIKAYNISKITCIRVKINTRAQNHFIFNYYNRFYYYHIL